MGPLQTINGILRWSRELDYFLEADSGGYWLLDMPCLMTQVVDELLHCRVVVEGLRSGFADIYLSRIEEAPLAIP